MTKIAIASGLIALGTFIKAILEYRLQGRQKRAELFDIYKNRFRTDKKLLAITNLLEDDANELKNLNNLDRYYFLGFYEQIAIAVNSGLIKRNVAHYIFGYFAIRCWESDSFWLCNNPEEGINRDSYYWSVFKTFVFEMKKLEDRRINGNTLQKIYDKFLYRRLYRF